MTLPHVTPEMLSSARAEITQLRGKLAATEAELTSERNFRILAEGASPWHPKQPLRERAPGFARQCSCDECKLICKVAGVAELQAQVAAAQGAPALAELRRALADTQEKLRRAEAKASEANRRADANEGSAKQARREATEACKRNRDLQDSAFDAAQAAERAIERARKARARAKTREAQAARALELAPYVRAALRSGRSGLSAVTEAKAAVGALQRGHT